MLNPIEKFKRSILHLNRSLHHCLVLHLTVVRGHYTCLLYLNSGNVLSIYQFKILFSDSIFWIDPTETHTDQAVVDVC